MVTADSEMMFHNSIIVGHVGWTLARLLGCRGEKWAKGRWKLRLRFGLRFLKAKVFGIGSYVLLIEKVATDW